MEGEKIYKRNRGGRPKKAEQRNRLLAIKCTAAEKKIIEDKAAGVNVTVSEYLRELALKSQTVRKLKLLPPEVLQFTGTLNHLAANINQIAFKRNSNDELNAIQRAELKILSWRINELAKDIKTYLK
jgi:hypothetical protein